MVSSFRTLWRLLRLTKSLPVWMLLATLLGVLTIGSSIGLLTFSAYLISEAALHPPLAAIAVAMVGVRVFGILRGIWRYLERLVAHDVTFRLLAKLRVWFYQALEPLAPARLMAHTGMGLLGYTSGDLLSRLVADTEMVQEVYVRALSPPVVALFVGLIMEFVLGTYSVPFAVTFLIFFLLAGVGVPLLVHLLSWKLGRRVIAVRAALNTTLIDSIQGVADLLAFEQENEQERRVQQVNQRLIRLQIGRAAIVGLRDALDILLTDGCTWVLLLVAIPLVRTGELHAVYLACIVLAALSSFEAVRPLSNAAQQFGGSIEATRRLFDVVDVQPAVCDPTIAVPAPSHYDLEVRRLSFHYPGQMSSVLHDISFSLPQGHCLAIVGPSGAGKSTLASLLLRFWEYEQGSISLGGQELKSFQQRDIHRLIGVVEQQTHLFNATIRENLLLARSDASQQEIEEAAQQAHIHEFIRSLPQGYDTLIGEQGFKLSGGERQRLAIARVILKNAPVLLLDEATAHLDAVTEQGIIHTLRAFMRGRTTVMITHRLIGLDMADEILVIQDGKIKERGVHHDLLQVEGLYWKLWKLQNQILAAEL